MKFTCIQSCYDNGTADRVNKAGKKIRKGYRRGDAYEIGAREMERLLQIGLFPECFGPLILVKHAPEVEEDDELDTESTDYWDAHIEEWTARAAKERVLPFRAVTEKEEQEIVKLMAKGKTRHEALTVLINAQEKAKEPVTA